MNDQDIKSLEEGIHNLEEEFHCQIEAKGSRLIEAILGKDLSFWDEKDACLDFALYISAQFLRTERMQAGILDSVKTSLVPDFGRVWPTIRQIQISNFAWNIFDLRDSMRIRLLETGGSGYLITGDQPVLNTYAIGLEKGELTTEIEIYYPLSPSLAILLSAKPENKIQESVMLSREQVDQYNTMIVDQSKSQIYALSAGCLRPYTALR